MTELDNQNCVQTPLGEICAHHSIDKVEKVLKDNSALSSVRIRVLVMCWVDVGQSTVLVVKQRGDQEILPVQGQHSLAPWRHPIRSVC